MISCVFIFLTRLGRYAAACVILTACGKTESPTASTSASSNTKGSKAMPMDRLEWNLKTLVGAYQQSGHTNPKWDEAVTGALTEFARSHCGLTKSNEDVSAIISNQCKTATEAGCDDPMVQYLHIRFCKSQSESEKAFAEAYIAAAQEMEKSSYPNIRKSLRVATGDAAIR